jgi:hypothetical protein
MSLAMLLPLTAAMHGTAVPILWIVGIVLLVAGVIGVVRGSLVLGVVFIVLGIVLGGLNIL